MFYVPIERKALPQSDPKRWMILPVDCQGEIEARSIATRSAGAILQRDDFTVWAALTVLPDFGWLARLRTEYDRARAINRKVNGARANANVLAVGA